MPFHLFIGQPKKRNQTGKSTDNPLKDMNLGVSLWSTFPITCGKYHQHMNQSVPMRLSRNGAESHVYQSKLHEPLSLSGPLSPTWLTDSEEKGQFSQWCICEMNWLCIVAGSQLTLRITHSGLPLRILRCAEASSLMGSHVVTGG